MGDVLLVYQVTVEEQDQLDSVEQEVRKINCGKLQEIKKEPFVFGTELLRVSVVVPDKVDGACDAVEDFLTKINGVASVNNIALTLI